MKLSEAIMLGSVDTKFDPSVYLCDGAGCLIGCAMTAFGYKTAQDDEWLLRFPWLVNEVRVPEFLRTYKRERPRLFGVTVEATTARALHIISCMAFMVQSKDITLEQAVDWVRSVEPKEEPQHVIRITEVEVSA